VHDTKPYRATESAELSISDALVIRWLPTASDTINAAETYAKLRDQWIESDPQIKGGKPVIWGTRIGVRGVAQRMNNGERVKALMEDYPEIPAEAFRAARTYANAHPRRGRPIRPWRDAQHSSSR
jgi:uncharacterized protein (DUF433 family)